MAWRILKQPNGKLARFSDVVDDFTHFDMTEEEAIELCRKSMGERDAKEKVSRAEENGKHFLDEIDTIKIVHGKKRSEECKIELST